MRALLLLVLALVSSSALACPSGPREDRLTFPQVMINFGRFLNPADLAALQGSNNRYAVTDADLARAIEGIAAAIDCADTVLTDKSGALYPPKYFRLPESDRAAFLQLFLTDMDNFRQGLASYKRAFVSLQGKAPGERDYREVEQDRQDVTELANTAHGDLK